VSLSRWAAPLGLLVAGVLHTASFAPLNAWPLQIAALAWLAWSVQSAGIGPAALRGFAFSLGWLSSGLWWLYISMHDYGGMPAALAAIAVLLLAAALSLYMAAAMAGFAWRRTGRPLPDALLFAAWWLLAELARAQWLTGFPWIASGYAHSDGPLAALAPWIGVYGMGAVAAVLAATVGHWARPEGRSWSLLALAAALVGAPWLAPREFTASTGTLRVSLLQPNVPQDLKFDPDRIVANMAALQAQLTSARGDLVVTPESVLPLPRDQLDAGYWQQLTEPFRASGASGASGVGESAGRRAALIGTFLGNEQDGYVNSLVGVSADGDGYSYGKRHLLPFGEFVPPGFHWFVELMQIPLGDQAPGRSDTAFAVAGQRVRPLICYEDLFGEDFASSLVGAEAATVLANASNLAWFGPHMIQAQHLQFSRLRALEFQRPLVRATNTGATAVVDHHGQVMAELAPLTAGVLEATVEGRRGATPYANWVSSLRLWPLWGLAGLVLLLAGPRERRRVP
jgi:apolipoprotein N-acyltransferase